MDNLHVGVLGGGVVGLTTSLELQKQISQMKVTIIADKFEENTTSDGAAGLFRPGTSFSGPTEEITRKWIYDSYNFWDDMRLSDGPLAGITSLSGYIFSSNNPTLVRNHFIENIVRTYRQATEQELQLCPGNWKYGSFFETLLIECRRYLPWAKSEFEKNGGKIVSRKINDFRDIADNFDIIVNCTGLGAKYLCNDYKLVPMRGQVLKVKAPWIKTFFYADYDTYIIPGFETVTLGGCRQYDSYNLNVCRHDTAAIMERCEKLLPSLKGAPILKEWVGLRPHRSTVRVEKEILVTESFNGKKIKIIHNYGHGGYGVTTAPGTAIHAVKLIKEFIAGNSKL